MMLAITDQPPLCRFLAIFLRKLYILACMTSDYLANRNILFISQFGFRKLHSTNHAVHHSINTIRRSHDENRHVLGIFIDLSKAFDMIDHSILLAKLNNFGIRGVAHNILKDYLKSRYQYVSIDDIDSSKLKFF